MKGTRTSKAPLRGDTLSSSILDGEKEGVVKSTSVWFLSL